MSDKQVGPFLLSVDRPAPKRRGRLVGTRAKQEAPCPTCDAMLVAGEIVTLDRKTGLLYCTPGCARDGMEVERG